MITIAVFSFVAVHPGSVFLDGFNKFQYQAVANARSTDASSKADRPMIPLDYRARLGHGQCVYLTSLFPDFEETSHTINLMWWSQYQGWLHCL
jgi:hypothetical protein